MPDINLPDINIPSFPGEPALIAFMQTVTKIRETMSQPNRDRCDAILLDRVEKFYQRWDKNVESIDKFWEGLIGRNQS